MNLFISRNKQFLLVALLFVISEIIVNPIGDFPLNDDWTYGKSVLIFQNEGRIDIGNFAAMSLCSHILWGFLFTKVFWFSFSVLRFSTLISSFIGIAFLYKLVIRITENKNLSLFSALILLFNPLYFNLSNTFMTDVNFNTLLIMACYFAYDFFKTQSRSSFLLVFLFSILLILLRQFGIIAPVCFTLTLLFLKQRKWLIIGFSTLLTFGVYAILKYYESYLRGFLGADSAYKFSSDTHIFSTVFWETFKYNYDLKHTQILLHILIYSSPLVLVYFIQIIKKFHVFVNLLVFFVSSALVYYLFSEVSFPMGNIFTNRALGAETFFETLFAELKAPNEHTFSQTFATQTTLIKYVLSTVSLSLLILCAFNGIRKRTNPFKAEPAVIFFTALLISYISLLLITESYFDRYHIPIITLVVLLLTFLPDKLNLNYLAASFILLGMFYVSVFGTKDYLELNRNRWEAYNYLKTIEKVDPEKINGGFEVNCWNEGKPSWWYDFFTLSNYDYLIQYRKEEGFKLYKEYPFQRYFPYKKDKIYIFVRQDKK
jgi:hypothetical protein